MKEIYIQCVNCGHTYHIKIEEFTNSQVYELANHFNTEVSCPDCSNSKWRVISIPQEDKTKDKPNKGCLLTTIAFLSSFLVVLTSVVLISVFFLNF